MNWPQRLAAAVDELRALAADVVALQEAPVEACPGRSLASYLEVETDDRHVLHFPYDDVDDDDRPEGLGLLSRFPVREVWTSWAGGAPTHDSRAAKVHVEVAGAILGVTNVHLDWQYPQYRVQAIADIIEGLIDRHPADVEILCGDFNDYEDGPVAAYLEGRGLAHGADRQSRTWRDAVVSSVGSAAPLTLDFEHNPRWAGSVVSERPGRFDRIYVRDVRGRPPVRITASGLFGRHPVNRFGIVPSDHYGVFVDLEL